MQCLHLCNPEAAKEKDGVSIQRYSYTDTDLLVMRVLWRREWYRCWGMYDVIVLYFCSSVVCCMEGMSVSRTEVVIVRIDRPVVVMLFVGVDANCYLLTAYAYAYAAVCV